MGKGKGGGGAERAGISRQIPDRYSWVKDTGGATTFVDLDRLDRPETVKQMNGLFAANLPVSRARTGRKWEDAVRDRAKKVNVAEAAREGRTSADY